MMKPILDIRGIGKRFQIQHLPGGYLSLRERLVNALKFNYQETEEFWALRDVSFEVQAGESIGIIGKNGAGKSTLLKVLSKITPPTEGKIISRGRIASLLEVGTGFHAELSGRENVFFNGSLLGMKRAEIQSKFDAIVDFSGVEKFLDTPLKHYSSGMQLRLAFSVAAFLEPEILIIDEVLAVGDAEFQKKCIGKMEDVNRSGRTILFVSHDLNAVSNLCKKVVILNRGAISFIGDTSRGISNYNDDSVLSGQYVASKRKAEKSLFIKRIQLSGADGTPNASFMYDEEIVIDFEISINDDAAKYDLFVLVLDTLKRRVFALESRSLEEKMRLVLESKTLVRGRYSLCVFINMANHGRADEVFDVCGFNVVDSGSPMLRHGDFDYGNVFGRGTWIKV